MTKRQRNLIWIGGAAAVLVLAITAVAVLTDSDTQTTDTETGTTETGTGQDGSTTRTTTGGDGSTTGTGTGQTGGEVVNQSEEGKIMARATSFTERYGSYSNDNNFENIEALRDFMTGAMSSDADAVVNRGNSSDEFYGITTKAAHTNIVEYTIGADEATVTVDTRRTETQGLNDPNTFSQTARLELEKVDGVWLVDNFRWQ